MNKMSSIKRNFLRTYGIISVLFLMILIMTIISPTFRTPENATNILRQVSVNGILSVAMTIVILTGGIDLTVGALLAVSGVIAGSILVLKPNYVIPAVVSGIVMCGAFGMMNGYFVAYRKVPPFVATLAGMTIARGFAYVYSDGKPYTLASKGFHLIGQGYVPIFLFLALWGIFFLLLTKTKFGRSVYATGGNSKAAFAAGINVKKTLLKVYILAGVLSGIAGIVLASRTNSGQPAVGLGYETDAIAATVIGGTSMTGGVGKMWGTLVGVLIIGVLNNSLNLLDVSSYWQQIIKGLIILGAVCFDIQSKVSD